MEIKGKMNTAIAYARVIEDEAIEQIRRMCDYDMAAGSKIRIMPDVHAGAGCTIGTTMTIKDKVVPNIVGVDIGCGMYTIKLKESEIDFARVDDIAHRIPSGRNVWDSSQKEFDLTCLRCYDKLRNPDRLRKSLGTLGSGNHFIELDKSSDGTNYLVIHTGSRNLGKQVAEYYQHLAIELATGKEYFARERERIVCEYKAAGRQNEIQNALKELSGMELKHEIPDDLCYVFGESMEDYLHDIVVCQQFATANRELIADKILEYCGLTMVSSFHTVHNYINTDEMILRKGAIAAHKNEQVLIPINMRDGSILAKGRGNPEWNYSAPHGAGRIMSRRTARASLDMDEYQKSMQGVYTTSINNGTIDEAPMAYKSINDILGVVEKSVDVIDILRPIYNFKASE